MEGQGLQDQQDALALCGSLRKSFEKSGFTQRRGEGEVKMLNFERWILNLARKLR